MASQNRELNNESSRAITELKILSGLSFSIDLLPFVVEMDDNIAIHSFIRSYHIYKDETTWVPLISEQHTLKHEPLNKKD